MVILGRIQTGKGPELLAAALPELTERLCAIGEVGELALAPLGTFVLALAVFAISFIPVAI